MQDMWIERFAGVFGEGVVVGRLAQPWLRPYVPRYIGYSENTAFSRRREPPTGSVTVIVDLGGGLTVLDPSNSARSRHELQGFVAGPSDHAVIVDSGGRQSGVQVDFTMVGARLLLGCPLRELTNEVVTLEELFGAGGRRLVTQLYEARSWREVFDCLDQELGARLEVCRNVPADLQWAWQALASSSGRRTVSELATDLNCSRKHLSTRFSTQLGLPPKTLASVLRFREVIAGLQRGTSVNLGELAVQCGYYDQAHLNRDFHRFAGITPSEHRRLYTPEFGLRTQ